MTRVQRFGRNTTGRDFVFTDVHGCYDVLWQAMKTIRFDQSKDRLFCVGDTVDRGPESRRALKALQQPWLHATLGNHEAMFLELYQESDHPHPAAIEFVTSRNGMTWWNEIDQATRMAFINEFRKLPVAIEIDTPRGTVGLVHAEVPAGLTWQAFLERVQRGDEKTIEAALWSRSRIGARDERGVAGVGRVFHGHTDLKEPIRLGNCYWIDTGAVFGVMEDDPTVGRLTMADILCQTQVLQRPRNAPAVGDVAAGEGPRSAPAPAPGAPFVDIRQSEPTERPFGAYAMEP